MMSSSGGGGTAHDTLFNGAPFVSQLSSTVMEIIRAALDFLPPPVATEGVVYLFDIEAHMSIPSAAGGYAEIAADLVRSLPSAIGGLPWQ
jgi:hypothetical protein